MTSILDLTDHAFRPGGAIDNVLAHRPEQYRAALWYAESLDAIPKGKIEYIDGSEHLKPTISLAQIPTGTGKTLAYLVPMVFMVREQNKRGLVSTYSRELRNEIFSTDADRARKIASIVYGSPIDVTFGLRESISAFASYWAADRYRRSALPEQRDLAAEYFEFVHSAYSEGQLPRLDDFPRVLELPSRRQFEVTVEERKRDRKTLDEETLALIEEPLQVFYDMLAAEFDDEEQNACDIVVTTHAMFLANNITLGKALGTKVSPSGNSRPFGAAMVDEADRMRPLAMQMCESEVDLMTAKEIVFGLTSSLVEDTKAALGDVVKEVKRKLAKASRHTLDRYDDKKAGAEKLLAFNDKLFDGIAAEGAPTFIRNRGKFPFENEGKQATRERLVALSLAGPRSVRRVLTFPSSEGYCAKMFRRAWPDADIIGIEDQRAIHRDSSLTERGESGFAPPLNAFYHIRLRQMLDGRPPIVKFGKKISKRHDYGRFDLVFLDYCGRLDSHRRTSEIKDTVNRLLTKDGTIGITVSMNKEKTVSPEREATALAEQIVSLTGLAELHHEFYNDNMFFFVGRK